MKNKEHFEKVRSDKHRFFSLRVRLTILVAIELIVSILLVSLLTLAFQVTLPGSFHTIPLLTICIISALVSIVVTIFMTKWFFTPIKELCSAMEKVADGDFKVQLTPKSSAREIQEIYSGFNLMTQELNSMEILQSDFVSNVSHEFKTPLSAIEGYATLLQDCDNLNPQQRQYVEKIDFNTRRLSTLTGNILLLSKIDNQHISTRQSTFRLDEQIRQSIVLLESAWEKKNIELDVEMENTEYTGNESLLYHVWDNLISNAIKFSPESGMVRIRLKHDEEHTIITIEDEGEGIPPESQKHIFDKFYQVDSSHRQEGNGLGLPLAKRIAILEGGDITAENLPEKGCRFTVCLKRNSPHK